MKTTKVKELLETARDANRRLIDEKNSKNSFIAIGELKSNPEYRNLIFPPTKEDLTRLRESIQQSNVQIPIIIDEDGFILDGHHRVDIAQEFKIEGVPFERKRFANDLEKKHFIINVNFSRRHLNLAQRADLALKLKEIETREAKQRQEATRFVSKGVQKKDIEMPQTGDHGKALDKLAQKAKLSRSTRYKVETIKQAGMKDETILKEWEKALRGKTSIQNVFSKVKRKEAQDEIRNYQVKNEEVMRDLEKNLRHGDFMKIGKDIPQNSVNLIFTDPPYGNDSTYLYEEIAILGKRVLKDGGSLLCYASCRNLPRILTDMGKHLGFWWVIPVRCVNKHPKIRGTCVYSNWKPILWFVKGNRRERSNYFDDVVNHGKAEKEFHGWQQSVKEAEYCISNLTKPGDMVLDPMLGTGTSGVAAIRLKRQFIGIEIDSERYYISCKRIAKSIELDSMKLAA